MSNLQNAFSLGTEGIPLAGDPARSSLDIPANEDWCMVCRVIAPPNEIGILQAKKIWDTGEKIYYVKLLHHGGDTFPQPTLTIGQYVRLHRAGDFKNAGELGFELHTEDFTKVSWVCFASPVPILIEDMGWRIAGDVRQGREVYYDESKTKQVPATSQTLDLQTIEPVAFYHQATPPWSTGRIYLGFKTSGYYLVHLPGFGDKAKTFSSPAAGITFSIDVDGQGNILDFTAT